MTRVAFASIATFLIAVSMAVPLSQADQAGDLLARFRTQ